MVNHGLKNGGVDQFQHALDLVKDAAISSPFADLKSAARKTLKIVDTVQECTAERVELRRLALDAVEVVSLLWKSFQKASSEESWAQKTKQVVEELAVTTLPSIEAFVDTQKDRGRIISMLYKASRQRSIAEFCERLKLAKFALAMCHVGLQRLLDESSKTRLQTIPRLASERSLSHSTVHRHLEEGGRAEVLQTRKDSRQERSAPRMHYPTQGPSAQQIKLDQTAGRPRKSKRKAREKASTYRNQENIEEERIQDEFMATKSVGQPQDNSSAGLRTVESLECQEDVVPENTPDGAANASRSRKSCAEQPESLAYAPTSPRTIPSIQISSKMFATSHVNGLSNGSSIPLGRSQTNKAEIVCKLDAEGSRRSTV